MSSLFGSPSTFILKVTGLGERGECSSRFFVALLLQQETCLGHVRNRPAGLGRGRAHVSQAPQTFHDGLLCRIIGRGYGPSYPGPVRRHLLQGIRIECQALPQHPARLVVRHILPSALAPVLVTAAFAVGASILLEAALSFLGLGVRPPTPTWGGMLTEARTHVNRAWWLAVFPGVALFVAVLGCNLLGEGIRDHLDPKTDA